MRFADRYQAGRRLAEELRSFADEDVVVLGLPRGGVPVASEVAQALDAPLDVIVVRKLGVPYHPELAMGAIGEGGARVINRSVVENAGVSEVELGEVEARESQELERRSTRFRAGRERLDVTGRTVLVVDDGIATGATVLAACDVARAQGATRVVVAAPVAPAGTAERLADVADDVVILHTPSGFLGVGQFYDDFTQTADDEVVELLRKKPQKQCPRQQ